MPYCTHAQAFFPQAWTLGTAFSGMETVTFALNQLGLSKKFSHKFAIKQDLSCSRFIKQNCKVERLYSDISQVQQKSVAPIDVYVAGFPCQPLSAAGKREGQFDTQGRGNVFKCCREYISEHRPTVFLLENVAALKTGAKFATFYKYMMKTLRNVHGKGYHIFEDILNTKEHGLPHNRSRLYVVGILKDAYVETCPFVFPAPVEPLQLKLLLESGHVNHHLTMPVSNTGKRNLKNALLEVMARGVDLDEHLVLVDIGAGPSRKTHWTIDEVKIKGLNGRVLDRQLRPVVRR